MLGTAIYQNNRSIESVTQHEMQQSYELATKWLSDNQDILEKDHNSILWWMLKQAAENTGNEFLLAFYKNYKNISSESNVKILLSDILKTRSTVKYYIYYNLTIMGVIGLHIFYIVYKSPQFLKELPENSNLVMVWIISITFLALALLVFWVFYRIIYGFFLKKLKKNYAELESNGLS